MTAKTNGQSEIEHVREELQQLREDVQKLIGSIGDATNNMTNRAVGNLSDTASDAYNRLQQQTQRYASTFQEKVSAHPFEAAAIALAVGVVVSRLLDRPSR
jgi:ElaB/YqjD/DUF883 family membrane-anchored ribosome-binding protein